MPVGNTTWDLYAYPNVTGWYDMFSYANATTFDAFGIGICASLFIVLFFVLKGGGTEESFAVSGFISFLASLALRSVGLIADTWMILFAVMTAVGVLILWRT